MLTGIERKMYDSRGHWVKVTTTDDEVFTGYCAYFTPDYDNDPEIASISLKDSQKNGEPFSATLLELEEPEIKEIELLD